MKTRIFQTIFLLLLSFLSFSCSHQLISSDNHEPPRTITSDLFPETLSRSEYYRELAFGYSQEDQNKRAIELYRLSLLHDPNNLKSRLQLADVYRSEGVDHLAHAQYDEVLRLDPKNAMALKRQADLYLNERIYTKAKEVFNEIVRVDPKNAEALWTLFSIAKEQQDFESALTFLDQLDKLSVDNTEIQFTVASEKASIYQIQKKWKKEHDSLLAAYTLKPNVLSNVNDLADSYFRFEKWKEAQSILQRYSDTNPFQAGISEKLSYSALQVQDFDTALREFAKQRDLSSQSYLIERKIAHIHFLQKDYGAAEKIYEKLVFRRADDDESVYFLSKIYQLTNRFSKSAGLLKWIPSGSDYFGEAQVELAEHEVTQKKPDAALERLQAAHDVRPDLKVIYKYYADLLIEMGQYQKASTLIEKGLVLFSRDEELRLKAAFSYYRINDQKSFQRHMAEAITLNPKNAKIYAALTEALQMKNKKPNEIKDFIGQALKLNSADKDLKPLLSWALLEQNRTIESVALFEECYEKNPNDPFYAKTLAQIYRQGSVTSKADSFKRVAQSIEAHDGLKSKLLNHSSAEMRTPASLEPN